MGLLVLVTGAAGSLGRQVCRDLLARGHLVRAIDLPLTDFSDLADAPNVEIARGDVRDFAFVAEAVTGVDWVLHLAAILPSASEHDGERTDAINVGGTRHLVDALERAGREAPLVLASTVAVFGDTSDEPPPVTVDRAPRPVNLYAESKVKAEILLHERGYPYTVVRSSGIAVPALLEPPEPWPFTAWQRVEFICRNDSAAALVNCVGNTAALGRTFVVAGGASWQLLGRDYAEGFYDAYELPRSEALYLERPRYFDWYDTAESNLVLDYQQTSHASFLSQLREEMARVFGR